jgi:broad specificity phosphatase PhoE
MNARSFLLAAASLVIATTVSAQSTLVFLVRHGEKAAEPANNPPLTPAGQARARALGDALAGAGITTIISTPFERTLATVRPLATRLGVTVDTIQIGAGIPAYARAVAAAVRKHEGQAIVVVGHSNTIMQVAAAHGAP